MTVQTALKTAAIPRVFDDIATPNLSTVARFATSLILIATATGCATPVLVNPSQSSIDSNVSVIAFSVDTSEWSEEDVWLRPKQLLIGYDDVSIPVPLDRPDAEPQRILLEVPSQEIEIDWYELDSGAGIFWKQYVSAVSQSFQLNQGEVNYLGRIEIQDVVFDTIDDEERIQPVQIKLAYTDTLADDLTAWEQDYLLIQEQAPERQIIGQVTGLEYKPVWEDVFDSVRPRPRRSKGPPSPQSGRKRSQTNRSRTRPSN